MKISGKDVKHIIVICVILVAFVGCEAGMSQQDRLNAFQADIEAGSDASVHFRGPNADSIGPGTFLSTSLAPGNLISFYSGDVISNDTFVITYNYTGGDDQASGDFINVGTGGLGGDDWYIVTITIDELSVPSTTETIP